MFTDQLTKLCIEFPSIFAKLVRMAHIAGSMVMAVLMIETVCTESINRFQYVSWFFQKVPESGWRRGLARKSAAATDDCNWFWHLSNVSVSKPANLDDLRSVWTTIIAKKPPICFESVRGKKDSLASVEGSVERSLKMEIVVMHNTLIS